MKISTKSVASMLLVTAVVTAVPGIGSMQRSKKRGESQFDRMLQRHDRKGELRAEILGIHPLVFKDMQKHMTFDEIVRKSGFSNVRMFRMALLGKLKNELHQRGWTTQRIERYMVARAGRM